MESLESELDRARELDVAELADAIESIGFECTRCGACCKAAESPDGDREDHTATVFPDEIRELQDAAEGSFDERYDWRDVARPMPYGIRDGEGETFEWALATDGCGDCTFYEEAADGTGACTVHDARPLICETYPFSVVLADGVPSDGGEGEDVVASEPVGEPVDREGPVQAHECEGLGRDIDRESAEELAAALKERAIRELKEALALAERYEPANADGVVVHDSDGPKRPDGTPL